MMNAINILPTTFSAPLTAAQLGIWLGQQLNSTSPMYNAAEFIELRGNLNRDYFVQALREVVSETVTLNLIFEQTAAGPLRRLQAADWQLLELDFSHSDAPLQQAQQWMRADLATCVDLTTGPLFRQALIQLAEQHYLWYQRIHHIACDGFGFSLITQAVAEGYNYYAQYQQHSHTVSTTANAGKQLTAFQSILTEDLDYSNSPALKKDRAFWLQHLAKSQFLEKKFSPIAIADTSVRVSSWVSENERVQLQILAAQLEISWSDLLIACVTQMLYQQTAAAEISIGLPVMNRMGSASLRVPAMVMNIIPLIIQFKGAKNFAALAQQVSAQLKTCRPHQRYRYEHLKRDLALGSEQRLFGAVINIMPFDRQLAFNNIQTQVHNLSAGPVEDISFAFVLDKNGGLRIDIDGNPNLYNLQRLQGMQQELAKQIAQVQHNPHLPLRPDINKISWLEGKILPMQKHSVLAAIYQHIEQRPQAIALQHGNNELTYESLATQSSEMAMAICDMDIAPNSVIALILPRGDMAISAALACLLIDCTFVFIDPEAPAARNRLILQDAQPTLIIVEPITTELNNTLLEDAEAIPLVTPQHLLCHSNKNAPQSQHDLIKKMWQQAAQKNLTPHMQNPAYLIYTSGSTGTPKGVAIGHQALAEFVASNRDSYCISSDDHVLQFAPLHFDACIEEIFVSFAVGARLVIRNSAMIESMPAFIAQCEKWQISVLDLPTAFWHELAYACTQLKLTLPSRLRTIIIGGEAVLAERVGQWRACYGDKVALFNTYGPSETTVIATCTNLCSSDAVLHKAAISIGEPLSGRALAVVDTHLYPLPKGEEGELLLMGAGLADGYLHLPEKTAQAFIDISLPWLDSPVRAYRTGDRVKINSENQVEFIGRLDDQIKISGYRIDPLEIEAALITLPNIAEAAVVAVAATDGNKMLIAHIASSRHYNIQDLRALLKTQLPTPMLPAQIMQHEKLPRNTTGKIDRKVLLKMSQKSAVEKEFSFSANIDAADFNVGQKIIFGLWQEVLGQQSIGLDDDFFALGGQSLQTIQVANRLTTQLERNIPVALLFQNPSIRKLADVLFTQKEMPATNVQEQMLVDCREFEINLPTAKQNNAAQDIPFATSSKAILLTGATGFVGAQLLHQLLTETNQLIICTVRAPSEGTAYQRLRKALIQQGLAHSKLDECFNQRVKIRLADLEQPRLGLSVTGFAALAQSVSAIIHNAANTSVMRDYQSLRAANALSTGELLKLAAMNSTPFHLVSTIAIAPPGNQLGENVVAIHSGLLDGYQQSKWVAEQMAAIAQQKGQTVNVYRLARVTGSAASGYVNPKDLVWSILQAGLPLGLLPDLNISEPWTPVDAIAQFIVRHVLAQKIPPRNVNAQQVNPNEGIFNLTPQQSIEFRQLYQWLAEAGATIKLIPISEWCSQVKQNGRVQDQAIVEFFLQRSAHSQAEKTVKLPPIDNRRFNQKASEYGIQIPAITQSLFNQYFAYATLMGWFARTQQQADAVRAHLVNTDEESLNHE
ncbi:MAG TPA: amino acid adenylation domain-containing protein [Cellvibrio sp.]|nr:amino acid adenylation domain-containing protein [Cellvibrio sp.]